MAESSQNNGWVESYLEALVRSFPPSPLATCWTARAHREVVACLSVSCGDDGRIVAIAPPRVERILLDSGVLVSREHKLRAAR
jgi:hypothetical protein